jgi:hypothetical protein
MKLFLASSIDKTLPLLEQLAPGLRRQFSTSKNLIFMKLVKKGKLNICSRGHKFYKSSDCPVCPKCWSGYYRQKNQGDFPNKLSAPALRALLNAKIFSLKQLSKHTEAEILKLYGMGPGSIPLLKQAMKKQGLKFKIRP